MDVKVTGIPELIKKSEELNLDVPAILGQAGYFAMASLVEKDAKALCPVDTGNLMAHIHTEIVEQSPKLIIVQTGTKVKYAPYVEFGTGRYNIHGNGRQTPWGYEYKGRKGPKGERWTVGQRPQPFLNPALVENSPKLPGVIRSFLDRKLEEMSRRK